MEFGSTPFWLAGVEIIVINILLSGDNAMVIALACRNLPGKQRRWAVFWGAAGVTALRILLTFFALSLLDLPGLKLVGALLLLWIGIRLIADDGADAHEIRANDRLLSAVRTIVVADLVMSVDNVIAVAAAAKGSVVLLVFGLALSIPLVIVASQLIMKATERFPWLIVAGGGLIAYVAGEMAVTDVAVRGWIDANAHWLHYALPIGCIGLVVGVARVLRMRRAAHALLRA